MAHLLAELAADHAGAPAIVDERVARTWRELDERVNRWVRVLRDCRLSTGDAVTFVVGNRVETMEALLACLHAGLTVVPANWRLTAPELVHLLADSGSRAVFVDAERGPGVAEALRRLGHARPVRLVAGHRGASGFQAVEPLLARADPAEPEEQRCGSLMLYTSGTTGVPKGVVNGLLPTGEPMGRVERVIAYGRHVLGIPAHRRALLAGPWYHSAQLYFALLPLLRGCRLAVRDRLDAAGILRVVDDERIAVFHLVPTQFVRLLRLPEAVRRGFRGDSLERVWHGGGPCPADVKRRMIEWWGPVLMEYYGATEGGVATLIDSPTWLRKPGSVGRPVPPNEILVVGADGAAVPPGTRGRVFLSRPPDRGFEYHNEPEKTVAAHLAPGVFTYGELGHVDEDGYLFLAGRADDMIVCGGVNVYPAEVAAVLLTHEAVRDAAVVGVPDDEYGERVLAVVELEPGTLRADEAPGVLARYCRARLAGIKVPRGWRITERLPRDATGKLRRHALTGAVDTANEPV